MATMTPSVPDYTDKDWESLNARLEHLLTAVFPTWTDYNRANFGNLLKESFAFCLDILGFYQDQQARETRWSTATQRSSLISLARLIGYELDGAAAASVDAQVTVVNGPALGKITIPAGSFIKTEEVQSPVRFQFLANLEIDPPSVTETGSVENSEPQQDPFVAVGEANEEFLLSQIPFLDGSEQVVIDAVAWAQATDNSFLDHGPLDKVYVIFVNQNNKATVRLGDGTNGAITTPGATVAIDYKIGGGESGNVEADTITKVESSFTDEFGNSVNLTVTNPLAASGGSNRETVEQVRERAPRSLRVLNRTVARTDFEDMALQNASVARALMLSSEEDAAIPENYGWLYLVPTGGGVPSGASKTAVEDAINNDYPPPLNFSFEARNPIYETVDVTVTVYPDPDVSDATLEERIRGVLTTFFAPLNTDGTTNTLIDFGFNYKDSVGATDPKIALSDVANLINDLDGIRRLGAPADGDGLTLNAVEDDVDLTIHEFPEAGNVVITNGDTSAVIYSGSIV